PRSCSSWRSPASCCRSADAGAGGRAGARPVRFASVATVAEVRMARAWLQRRSYRADDYPLGHVRELRRRAGRTVSVVLPAREVAETIGAIVDALEPLRSAGVVDELVVVDAASQDGTAAVARAHGARVVQESDVLA